MRAATALLVCAALALAGDGTEVKEISFAEAVDLGLAQNLGLRSTRLDALMKRLVVEQADAAWDPRISTEIGGGESLMPSRSQLSGADVVDADSAFWAFGVSKPLRLGPTLGVSWRADRTFTNSSFSTINPAYDTSLEISVTVPLLRGMGRKANESELRASRASAEGARFGLRDQAARLIESVAAAYWDLVYRQDRVAVLEKSVAVAREIEANERRKLRPEIGRSTLLDVTQAAAQTKRREAALIMGRNELADAADELRRLILPFTGGQKDRIVFRAVQQPAEKASLPDLAELVGTALARRPDLKQVESELRRLHESVVQAEDGLRFQLDLKAAVTWRAVDGRFSGSAGDTLAGDRPSGEGSLLFVWPFGRRAAKAELRRARLDVERQRVLRDALVSDVIIEVRRSHRAQRTAVLEIGATREEQGAAQAALDGERKRLERGSSTVLDVSRLEEHLTDAQLRLLQSRTGLEHARVGLMRASGTLLERFGVRLTPKLELDSGK